MSTTLGAILVLGFVGGSACGPVTYFRTVSGSAAAEVAAARAAGAERSAPSEYTAAVLYLDKAHEEAGHSDWQAAIRLGKMAREQAARARKIALGRPGDAGADADTDADADGPGDAE